MITHQDQCTDIRERLQHARQTIRDLQQRLAAAEDERDQLRAELAAVPHDGRQRRAVPQVTVGPSARS